MPTAVDIPRDEREKVEAWRLYVLVDAGYPLTLAEKMAHNLDVDVHRAVELIEQGCEFATAAEILL